MPPPEGDHGQDSSSCACNSPAKGARVVFWLHQQHMQVPGPGIKPEPQQGQHWILNLLSLQGTPGGEGFDPLLWTCSWQERDRWEQEDTKGGEGQGIGRLYRASSRSGSGSQGLDKSWPPGVCGGRTRIESTGFSRDQLSEQKEMEAKWAEAPSRLPGGPAQHSKSGGQGSGTLPRLAMGGPVTSHRSRGPPVGWGSVRVKREGVPEPYPQGLAQSGSQLSHCSGGWELLSPNSTPEVPVSTKPVLKGRHGLCEVGGRPAPPTILVTSHPCLPAAHKQLFLGATLGISGMASHLQALLDGSKGQLMHTEPHSTQENGLGAQALQPHRPGPPRGHVALPLAAWRTLVHQATDVSLASAVPSLPPSSTEVTRSPAWPSEALHQGHQGALSRRSGLRIQCGQRSGSGRSLPGKFHTPRVQQMVSGFCFLSFCHFLGPLLQHMEVPKLGVELEL